jgi:predicted Zn finger-like uncharacterized protein
MVTNSKNDSRRNGEVVNQDGELRDHSFLLKIPMRSDDLEDHSKGRSAAVVEGFTSLQNRHFCNDGHNTLTRKERNGATLHANFFLWLVPPLSHYAARVAWGLLHQRPFASVMHCSEPILFSCPSCGAKYKIATIDSPGSWYHGKVACSRCNTLFPAGDEHMLFKYVLVWPPGSERKRAEGFRQ